MKKINEGYCAELFETGDGRLLKLYRRGWSKAQVLCEYENTKAMGAAGVPVPAVYGFYEKEGRAGFLMEKLSGSTMLQIIQKTPHKAISLAKRMAALHYEMHCVIPDGWQLPPQKAVYAKAIQGCRCLDANEKAGLMQRLDALQTKDARICHGDFHAMNILLPGDGVGIIDWAFATLGDPCADVAGTYMITKLLASASGGHNAYERFLFDLFVPLFANAYLKEYLKRSGRTRKEILQWIPVRAATYVDLGLPERIDRKLYQLAGKK